MMICPVCDGERGHTVYLDPGFRQSWKACDLCRGEGEVSAEAASVWQEVHERADRLRNTRIHGGEHIGIHDAAQRCGLDVVEYSHREHGQTPMTEEEVVRLLGLLRA